MSVILPEAIVGDESNAEAVKVRGGRSGGRSREARVAPYRLSQVGSLKSR